MSKDVEPDFAEDARKIMGSVPGVIGLTAKIADGRRAAFAAGRQAAPQPEGGSLGKPCLCRFVGGDRVNECDYHGIRRRHRAALEAALRPFADWITNHDGLSNGTHNMPDTYRIGKDGPTLGQLRAVKAALTPTSSAADGKGEER